LHHLIELGAIELYRRADPSIGLYRRVDPSIEL
jgi:hypothetical protein